jgi:hypothetical protein
VKKTLIAAAVIGPLLAAAVLLGFHLKQAGPAKPRMTTLTGDFTLWAAAPRANPCEARPDAPDIHPGAPVDVRDESGATVAGAILAEGVPEETKRGCVYHFSVEALPDAASYTVQVGARVGPTYKRADIAQAGWRVALDLGLPDQKS